MRNANLVREIQFNPDIQHLEIYPYEPSVDINPIMLEGVPKLISLARHARWTLTESDRVHVGVSAFAYDPSPVEPRYAYVAGGNYKERLNQEEYDPSYDVKDIPKNCGEQNVMHAVQEARLKRIGLIVVSATTDTRTIKGITHVQASTLHPCNECRKLFSKNEIVDNNTIVLTIGDEKDRLQVMSVGKLLKLYDTFEKTGEYKDPRTYDYEDYEWPFAADVYKWRRRKSKKPIGGSENGRDPKQIAAGHRLALKVIHEVLD